MPLDCTRSAGTRRLTVIADDHVTLGWVRIGEYIHVAGPTLEHLRGMDDTLILEGLDAFDLGAGVGVSNCADASVECGAQVEAGSITASCGMVVEYDPSDVIVGAIWRV